MSEPRTAPTVLVEESPRGGWVAIARGLGARGMTREKAEGRLRVLLALLDRLIAGSGGSETSGYLDRERLARAMLRSGVRSEPDFGTVDEAAAALAHAYETADD